MGGVGSCGVYQLGPGYVPHCAVDYEAGSKTGTHLHRCQGSVEHRVSYSSFLLARSGISTRGNTGPLNTDLGGVLQKEIRDSPWTLHTWIFGG